MERFVKGDVVVLPFPFSDLSASKKRPALVVANLQGDDLILCQITTATRNDGYAVSLSKDDFKEGSLPAPRSLIRTNKIFTADTSLILYKSGSLKLDKVREVEKKLAEIFTK
jgi:mRNA interferase MazF